MHDVKTMKAAALLIAAALAATACGRGESEPDPAALDAHFNNMIAEEEAERRRLVEAARDREDIRENEMDQREENYAQQAD
jgi:flagellar motility protein MotE (MotC chaperone)